ncbi:hypothetical protein ACP70R_006595 [Stipagrostis hirtigluma subsp. patula]
MDRSWMSKPRRESAYKDGVDQFLSFAFRDLPHDSKIFCPCKNCQNRVTQNRDEVETHLKCDGILQGYTTWIHHGEEYDSSPSFAFAHVPNDTTSLPTSGVPRTAGVQDDHGRLDDMQGLLEAAFVVTPDGYESLSSVSEAELDDFIPEFPDMEHNLAEDEPPASEDGALKEQDIYASILKDAQTRLYNGCEQFSKLSFIVNLYHLKFLHGWTQESFTSLLGVLSAALPPEANLPKNYYEAKKIIRGLGLDYVKIHACPKDCMLYRGDRANQESCHVCGSSRWEEEEKNGSAAQSKRKKKPAKVLRYFPLIPRIQRLFATNKTSDDMRWHDEGRTKDGKLRHPADGEAWKDFDRRYPEFAADARNVRLGLASDGFNPFRNLSSKHSTWPVMLIPYNLPPWICMKQTSLILSMIIPGPDSPGNDIDVYLQPLIDELLQLWGGVETFDASSKKKFSLRAMLLWTLNDFPALAYLYGWSTGGKYACPSCGIYTKSYSLKKSKKCCFMGHRRWLPQGHAFRRQKRQFDGKEETEIAPQTMSGSSVLTMLQGRVFVLGKKVNVQKKVSTESKGENNTKKKGNDQGHKRKRTRKKKSDDNHGKTKKQPEDWLKKKSIFFMLPYWEHHKLRHNLDVMHIEKNVCDNLVATLLDIEYKTKDGLNARLDLVEIGIRQNLHPVVDDDGKRTLPDAPFTMSRDKKEMLFSIIHNIRTPDGYASNLSRCFKMGECKFSGLKSHDNHVLLQDLFPAALRSCYPSKDVMKIVVELANFFKKLCSKVLDVTDLDKLQEDIVMTLCNMEKIFLPSFFTVMVHLMVHLVEEVKLGGPVHYRWMYPLERFFVRLKALVKNKAHPEGSIAEGYRIDECMTFCSRFLQGTTRFTRPARNPDPPEKVKDIYLFESAGEPIGKATTVGQLDNQLLVQAHRYILRHCDELEDFRKEFVNEESSKLHPSTSLTHSAIEKLMNDQFGDWLEQKVLLNDGPGITEKVRALAAKPCKCGVRYSGYIINGFRFHIMSREAARKTQNSGVVNIADDGVNYYGRLSDIIELSYRDYKVVLFRCDWYDVHHRAGIRQDEFGFTLVNFNRKIHTGERLEHDPFVFSSQVQQVFYVEDPKAKGWNVVVRVTPRDLFDMGAEQSSDEAD